MNRAREISATGHSSQVLYVGRHDVEEQELVTILFHRQKLCNEAVWHCGEDEAGWIYVQRLVEDDSNKRDEKEVVFGVSCQLLGFGVCTTPWSMECCQQ